MSSQVCDLSNQAKIALVELTMRRATALEPGSLIVQRDDWVQMTTPSAPTPHLNTIKHSQVAADEVDGVIANALEHYRKLSLPFSWSTGPSTKPDNLADILVSKRFTVLDTTIGMIISSQAGAAMEPQKQMTYKNLDTANFEDFIFTQQDAWELPAQGAAWMRKNKDNTLSMQSAKRRTIIGYCDGKPAVAAGYIVYDDRSLHLVGGAVVKAHRKKGLYRDIVRHRLMLARDLKINFVTVHCLEHTSAPICAKLGFEPVCKFLAFSSPK